MLKHWRGELLFPDIFHRGKPKNGERARVTITSINIKFMGETHSLMGREVKDSIFELSLPFQNKIGSDLLPDMLKGPKLTLSRIDVSPPFQLVEVSPKPPVDIEYMGKTVFKLRIKVPEVTYEGPLAISFGNEPKETVNINLSKITLSRDGNKVDLEDSAMVVNMQKGQIFKRSVQLYKIMSYNDSVNSILLNHPFELVSTDPKMPLILDRKDSYILDLYIKAPDYSYAGTLDLVFNK